MSVAMSHDSLPHRYVRLVATACCMQLLLSGFALAQTTSGPTWLGPLLNEEFEKSNSAESLFVAAETPSETTDPLELPAPQTRSSAGAEGPQSPTDELDEIMRRLDAIEKSLDKPPEEKKVPGTAADKKPIDDWVDLSAEKWTVKLGGHVQMDTINWADHDPQVPADNYFEFRRLRLMADGVGYGVYDFRLQVDFEPESGEGTDRPVVDVKDAYFTANELPNPIDRWRIGNFFVPFSLEQVTNDTNNIFLERSIPTQGIFAANREVGMAIYGVNDAKNFTWTFGTFLDSISESAKERIDDNQGQRISSRLTYLPYYDEPSNGRYLIHTGAGVLYTKDQDGLARFRARPQIHEGPFLIDSGPLAAGEYTTGNLEFATVWGPFAVQSEAFLSDVNLIAAEDAWLWGAYVHCSYFLTGENRVYERYGQHGAQFGRQQTFSNFFWVPGCCGPGAWEMKARWSNLTLTEVDSGQYNDLTLGFNWYWSDRTRIMFDYIHPVTAPGTTPFGATTSDIIGMRFDFNW
jgi:phosphate-selective porin OprO/OprP